MRKLKLVEESWTESHLDIDVDVTLTIWYNTETHEKYGHFQVHDGYCYDDGTILITGEYIVDYDGIVELPESIIAKLNKWGYSTEEIE